jgi:hypothetical protein
MSTVTYIIDDISVANAQLAAAQHNRGYRRTHDKTAQSKYMIVQSGDRMSFDCDGHVSILSLYVPTNIPALLAPMVNAISITRIHEGVPNFKTIFAELKGAQVKVCKRLNIE